MLTGVVMVDGDMDGGGDFVLDVEGGGGGGGGC